MAADDTPTTLNAEQLQALKDALAASEDLKRLNEELNKLTDKQLESLKEMEGLQDKIKTSATAILSTREKSVAHWDRELENAGKMLEKYKQLKDSADKTNLIRGQELKIAEAKLQQLIKQHEVDEEIVANYDELIREQERVVAIARLAVEEAEQFELRIQDSIDAAKNMGSAIGAAGQVFQSNFTKHAGEFVKIFQGGTLAAGQLMKTMATGLGTAAINNMAGLVVQLSDMESGFRKATGASAGMARSVTEVYEATRLYGVSAQEASAATQALFTTFTDFTMVGSANQEMLAQSAAVLGELGVANADFAKGIQISTKALGMSTAAAEHTQRELVTFAKELGVAPQQMAADFANAGNMMAKMGDQGVKAFKDLAHVSKITGMEVQKLLNITNKFDTFEGAAEQAGKLNAALGGNFVNAMDLMMETDPAARFNMIRDSILDAGLSFDEMSYYQKNFYKDALGLSDVGDLAMMLSGNMDNLGGATNKTADELVALKENAAAVQSLQEQFNAVMAAATPVLTPLMDLLKGMLTLFAEIPILMPAVITAVTSYTVVMKGLALWNALATASQTTFNAALAKTVLKWGLFASVLLLVGYILYKKVWASNFIQGLVKLGVAMFGVSKATDASGRSMRRAAPGFMAFGAGMLAAGAGIGFAAKGFADLALSFKDLGDNAKYAALAIGIVTVAMIAMMIALAVVAVKGGAIGIAAMVAMGAAALALGYGISLATEGFTGLVTAMVQGVPALTDMMGAMYELASVDGLNMVALQIEKIANAIKLIPESKAIAMSVTMDSLAKLAENTDLEARMTAVSEGLTQMGESAPQVGESMTEINSADLARTAAGATVLATAVISMAALPGLAAASAVSGGSASGPIVKQPITIQLDRHKVGSAMVELWAEKSGEANDLR